MGNLPEPLFALKLIPPAARVARGKDWLSPVKICNRPGPRKYLVVARAEEKTAILFGMIGLGAKAAFLRIECEIDHRVSP
ncbi:hypothetical protein DYQ86_16645 [Acidobacteria bacterium AB60]|nr:hypothetical protein DYQ86_16645 [Acidobacteria bacterium AB60]